MNLSLVAQWMCYFNINYLRFEYVFHAQFYLASDFSCLLNTLRCLFMFRFMHLFHYFIGFRKVSVVSSVSLVNWWGNHFWIGEGHTWLGRHLISLPVEYNSGFTGIMSFRRHPTQNDVTTRTGAGGVVLASTLLRFYNCKANLTK